MNGTTFGDQVRAVALWLTPLQTMGTLLLVPARPTLATPVPLNLKSHVPQDFKMLWGIDSYYHVSNEWPWPTFGDQVRAVLWMTPPDNWNTSLDSGSATPVLPNLKSNVPQDSETVVVDKGTGEPQLKTNKYMEQ